MEKFIPLLKQNNIPYIREEKSGFFTILVKDKPNKNIQLVNTTAKFIMDCCNGINSVEHIVAQLVQKYPKISKTTIKEDVMRTLRLLDDLGLLSWKSGNPFIKRSARKDLNGRQVVYRAEEGDFGQLCEIIQDLGISNLSSKSDSNIFYIAPFVLPRFYDATVLRPRFFNHNEVFFILERRNKPSGFFSIMDSQPLAPIAQVTLVALNTSHKIQDVEKLISSAIEILNDQSVLTKLKWTIPCENLSLIDLVQRLGFKKEATLYHEIGKDKHVDIFSIYFG